MKHRPRPAAVMRALGAAIVLVCAGGGAFCDKVPIDDIGAHFALADATWFEEEQTLFVFYRAQAAQGLGPDSQIELAYTTDDEVVDFTPLQNLTTVHTHVAVDCGTTERCGSTSIKVAKPPRDVQLQLRFRKNSALTVLAKVAFNIVNKGPPFSNRSLLVYGVFDETNTRVQWRSRNVFPDVRNEEATQLGLRRKFDVDGAAYGDDIPFQNANPYGYGERAACVGDTALGWEKIETTDRAKSSKESMPLESSAAPVVCATSTVTDALGTFTATAFARKNPQTEPAFPLLHNPVRPLTVLPFFLKFCDHVISEVHEAEQKQRLLLPETVPVVCVENFADPSFPDSLASTFQGAIDAERAQGNGDDTLLVFALHHDDKTGALAAQVQQALAIVMAHEVPQTSPHAVGAFVYDSFGAGVADPVLARVVLWCPADLGPDLDNISDASLRDCPLQPDIPDLKLGPFKFNSLPILPTRQQLLTFLSKYSAAQEGHTTSLTFRAPEQTPLSIVVPVGDFGIATFYNDELLTLSPGESLSFCAPSKGAPAPIVFTTPAGDPLGPLSQLPTFRHDNPDLANFPLGLLWDFSFLTRMKFETALAGAATEVSVTIPFGIASQSSSFLGTTEWETSDFDLSDELLRCDRFCNHPTFDSAGVYDVRALFDVAFLESCYRPKFPAAGSGGFPSDP